MKSGDTLPILKRNELTSYCTYHRYVQIQEKRCRTCKNHYSTDKSWGQIVLVCVVVCRKSQEPNGTTKLYQHLNHRILYLLNTIRWKTFIVAMKILIPFIHSATSSHLCLSFLPSLLAATPKTALERIHNLYMYNDTSSIPFDIRNLILCTRPCVANGTCILYEHAVGSSSAVLVSNNYIFQDFTVRPSNQRQ